LKENKNFSFSEIILKLLSNPSIASKRWIYKQYDSQVQANTVFTPGKSDAAVVRLREQNKKNKSKVFLVSLLQLNAIVDGLLLILLEELSLLSQNPLEMLVVLGLNH